MSRWPSLIERLESKIEFTDSCWIWRGAVNKQTGYGQVYALGKQWKVHRLVYTLLVGAIPDGLDLDHVKARGCTRRDCCNPAHLEPVTRSENNRRGCTGDNIAAAHRTKTRCPRGHEYDYVHGGKRFCRRCRAAAQRRYLAKGRR